LPHAIFPPGHPGVAFGVHCPFLQYRLISQLFPQAPQLSWSVLVLTHARLLHRVKPARQLFWYTAADVSRVPVSAGSVIAVVA
jgi:hypothetical protein